MRLRLALNAPGLGPKTTEALSKLPNQESKALLTRMKKCVRDGGSKLRKHVDSLPAMMEVYLTAAALNPWTAAKASAAERVPFLPGARAALNGEVQSCLWLTAVMNNSLLSWLSSPLHQTLHLQHRGKRL